MPKAETKPFVLNDALLNAYATNDNITRYLIENLDPKAWRAEPPTGKGRTIAAVVAHIHNVRVMWLKVINKDGPNPEQLDRHTVTPGQAVTALAESGQHISRVIAAALAGDGRVKYFKPDVAGFIGYAISHDAHHRGQISMLARQAGYAIPQKAMFGMWEWGSRDSNAPAPKAKAAAAKPKPKKKS
ncbi:MAG: DinB family protein [Acidobacteriota bacterium]